MKNKTEEDIKQLLITITFFGVFLGTFVTAVLASVFIAILLYGINFTACVLYIICILTTSLYLEKIFQKRTNRNEIKELKEEFILFLDNLIEVDKTPKYSYDGTGENRKNAYGKLPERGRWLTPSEMAISYKSCLEKGQNER